MPDDKPSRNEDEYFAKQDAQLMREMRARLDQERATQRQDMNKCPRDGSALQEESRGSVKIDVCPSCGGIWLDKGELEMLQRAEQSGSGGLFGFFSGKK